MNENTNNEDVLDFNHSDGLRSNGVSSLKNIGISQKQFDFHAGNEKHTIPPNVSGFFSDPTLEEKIDYIYKTLKAQKRNARIKLFLKIFIILAIYYFVVMIYPTIGSEKIDRVKQEFTNMISSQVSSIAKPLIEDITKDMMGGNSPVVPENISSSKVEELLQKYPHLKDKFKQ